MVDPNLVELANDLAREAGERIVRIPGCRAVCVTFVGDDMPVGVIVYDRGQPESLTAIEAVDRLAAHIHVLAGSLAAAGKKEQNADARNHSSGVGGQEHSEAHADPGATAPDATSDPAS